MNFDMCELIEIGATQIMTDIIIADPCPWRPDYIEKCVTFDAVRKFSGNHGNWSFVTDRVRTAYLRRCSAAAAAERQGRPMGGAQAHAGCG